MVEEVFFLLDLLGDNADFLLVRVHLLLFNHHFEELVILHCPGYLVHRLRYSEREVRDLGGEEDLEEFHFLLECQQFSLVDLLQNPLRGLVNCIDGLLLHLKHLRAYLCLEVLEKILVNALSLRMQILCLGLDVFEDFLVDVGTDIYVVESVLFVLVPNAFGTNSLFVIKAEKF